MRSRILTSLLAAAALFVGTGIAAYAQCPDVLCLPNGTQVTCQVNADGSKVWVDGAGNTYPGNTGGTGGFNVVQCACGNTDIILSPIFLQIQSDGGPLGAITTTLDPTQPFPLSFFRSNQLPNTFPATVEFSFPVRAQLSSKPGQSFRGLTLLRFRNDNVNSFNPFQDEHFVLQEPVSFVDDCDNIVFTLKQVTIRLN